ncbi:MAG: Sodium:dicarboxylate symporter family protein [Gammaproteobacteria bacterium]|jgi:Na+/H+-dicarboxylate symporter|nr:Sodium:dicarboxylate symporter family protein [Gammaproteobacteria bacterium]
MKNFGKIPLVLLAEMMIVSFLTPFMPLVIQQSFYALSLSIKASIIFLLPLIIFGLLFKTAVGLARQATTIILLVVGLVCLSNFTSTFLSHYVGARIYHFNMSLLLPKTGGGLAPLWLFTLPKLIPNDKAMLAGIVLGIFFGNYMPSHAKKIAMQLETMINKLLSFIIYVIPFFIAGFIVKLASDGVIHMIVKDYSVIFAIVAVTQLAYIFSAYFMVNRFQLVCTLRSVRNMLPAALTGFSTMSSAAAMPFTIAGVKRNSKNSDLVSSIVPATVNIHLVGDCFAIPIFAYAVLKSFGFSEPTLAMYLVFTTYFVLAKFSVAAIPGGGIIVMLPILESYLGFNAEMLSLITALYILFDPVITCANVLGNGAFALLADKLLRKRKTFLIGKLRRAR